MDALLGLLAFLIPFLVVLFSIGGAAIKIVQEYERGVIFRLGRLVGARGPGLFLIIPFVDRMVKVDLRVVTLDVPRPAASQAATTASSACVSWRR